MSPSTCLTCGIRHVLGDVCPARVLAELSRPQQNLDASGDRPDANAQPDARLEPGDELGPYRIERLIGRGGMGEVYEATHTKHGRRIALKVLTRPLRRPFDRERFLAEGRMAAAFTHPNSVYVFETRDIGGIPTIAMELLPGDTLQDRVRRVGPLSPKQAADVILQVIAGLQAADDAGVIHRDVKPANCLIDLDGTIKIGDFGLSISPGHAGMSPSSFAGTPYFAAPEQLRGDRLDRRADIYAVGATLVYLVTGHPPYQADDLGALQQRIENHRPDLTGPEKLPPSLQRVIERCLAPRSDARYQGYIELRADLLPFTLRRKSASKGFARVTEIAFEVFALLPALAFFTVFMDAPLDRRPGLVGATVISLLGVSSIWNVLRGQNAGQLRNSFRPAANDWSGMETDKGWTRTLLRGGVLAFLFLAAIGSVLAVKLFPNAPLILSPIALLCTLGLAFAVVVRKMGSVRRFRDALTAKPLEDAPAVARVISAAEPKFTTERMGPYFIVRLLGQVGSGKLLAAWDHELRRHVWILRRPASTPPVSSDVRTSLRVSRLRWLQGYRSLRPAWDAFEAPDGQALLSNSRQGSWQTVVVWLLDLASELKARGFDASTETSLQLDRIWITERNRGMILDFPAPGVRGPDDASYDAVPHRRTVQQWLHEAASVGLSPSALPLPLEAAECLRRLEANDFSSLDEVTDALRTLQATPDRINRNVRAISLSVSLLVVLLVALFIGEPVRAAMTFSGIQLPGAMTPLLVGMLVAAMMAVAISAAAKSGFWLTGLRLAVVTRDGEEVSRARAALRAALAWSWVPLHVLMVLVGGTNWVVPALAGAVACFAVVNPARGLHDRLAGTYLVPR